jgi:dihydropteroate synthase
LRAARPQPIKYPLIMGIINLTDDSFSGDGHARRCQAGDRITACAWWRRAPTSSIIGAESSRPGATQVSLQQELDRVLPVIEGLRHCGVPLSVDTVKTGSDEGGAGCRCGHGQ